MENDLYGGQKKVWKVLRNRKKAVNEEIQINAITPEKWTTYMKNLYKNQEDNKENTHTEINLEQNLEEENITQEEVHEAITKLKNRKAPGPDNIPNEMIKYGGPELERTITGLYQKIIKSRKVPDEWKKSIIIPIFKKGNKHDPNNYRAITLLNTMSKLLTKIITNKITKKITSEEQQGFRQNRSTIDAIFIIRQLIEKSLEFNKPLYLCLVDLTKAFDRAQLSDVLSLLQENKIEERYIKVIEHLNKNNEAYIKTNQGLTEEVPIMTGIRQGDSMSPTLFNLIMDKIIQNVKEVKGGYRMGQKSIKILCYADDAILLAENEDDLQRLLYRFQKTAERYNMLISVEKS